MKNLIIALALILIINISEAKENVDISLININHIGPKFLNEIKNNNQIEWWVEMGDKMAIATFLNSKPDLPSHINPAA